MKDRFEEERLEKKYQKVQEESLVESKKEGRRKRGSSILFIVVILILLSIANMFSVSLGLRSHQLNIVAKHALMIITGLIAMFLVSRIPYQIYRKPGMKLAIFFLPLFIFIFMLFAPSSLVPLRNGAKAWILLGGFAIQPAELFKVSYTLVLAAVLAKWEEKQNVSDYTLILLVMFFIWLPYAIFILLQNDLGAIIHYTLITGYLLILSNISIKIIRLWSLVGILGIVGAFAYIYSIGPEGLSGYKKMRIYSFLDGLFTGNYSPEFGYQVKQALIGFGSGGFLGKGFGNGIQKYSYVPETATDFITVTFGEELGFVGMISLLALYFLLYWILVTISRASQDAFGKYLSAGIGAYLITQVFINIGVAVGIIPVFGLTLPLFSNGGSSIIATLVALGICININQSSHNR